jgi:hypothetical protein
MKNEDDESFDYDSVMSKFGTIIMFGTLIYFLNNKINLMKKSEFKYKDELKDNVDVDSRILVKLSCLKNIGNGLDDLPGQKNERNYLKFFSNKICSIFIFFCTPILDIIEILRIIFELINARAIVSNQTIVNKMLNNTESKIRKVKSCAIIKYNSEETKEDSSVKENNLFYNKCILELMKMKNNDLSISNLLNDAESKIKKAEKCSNISNESSRSSCSKNSNKSKSSNSVKRFDRVKDIIKTEKMKTIPKPKDCLIEKKREKIGNKRVLNITDSIIQNVALNVCSNENEEVNFVQISNLKSNIYNGRLKFGS